MSAVLWTRKSIDRDRARFIHEEGERRAAQGARWREEQKTMERTPQGDVNRTVLKHEQIEQDLAAAQGAANEALNAMTARIEREASLRDLKRGRAADRAERGLGVQAGDR